MQKAWAHLIIILLPFLASTGAKAAMKPRQDANGIIECAMMLSSPGLPVMTPSAKESLGVVHEFFVEQMSITNSELRQEWEKRTVDLEALREEIEQGDTAFIREIEGTNNVKKYLKALEEKTSDLKRSLLSPAVRKVSGARLLAGALPLASLGLLIGTECYFLQHCNTFTGAILGLAGAAPVWITKSDWATPLQEIKVGLRQMTRQPQEDRIEALDLRDVEASLEAPGIVYISGAALLPEALVRLVKDPLRPDASPLEAGYYHNMLDKKIRDATSSQERLYKPNLVSIKMIKYDAPNNERNLLVSAQFLPLDTEPGEFIFEREDVLNSSTALTPALIPVRVETRKKSRP